MKYFFPKKDMDPRIKLIAELAAKRMKVDSKMLFIRTRKREAVRARYYAFYLARTICLLSLKRIGEEFGMLDHSTILYGLKKVQDFMDINDDQTKADIAAIHKEIFTVIPHTSVDTIASRYPKALNRFARWISTHDNYDKYHAHENRFRDMHFDYQAKVYARFIKTHYPEVEIMGLFHMDTSVAREHLYSIFKYIEKRL